MSKKGFARQLRRCSTDAERRLWLHLRGRRFCGCKFRRQEPIGRFIVDFVAHDQKIVIELDGGQHYDARRDYDLKRDAWLRQEGYQILRFPDNLVLKETNVVLDVIWRVVQAECAVGGQNDHPHPAAPPSPIKGEGFV